MDFDSISPSPILGTLAKSLRVGDKHWSGMMLSVNRVQTPTLPSPYEEQKPILCIYNQQGYSLSTGVG